MSEGNKDDGELEIGQVAGLINEIKSAKQIVNEIISEYYKLKEELVKNLF